MRFSASCATRRNARGWIGFARRRLFRDPLFKNTREIGNRFQDGLSALFFATDSELTEATQRFGVF